MRILVTRPALAGETLVRRLSASGFAAWHWPLLEFLPGRDLDKLPDLVNQLHCEDVLFVVSGQAVTYAHAQLQRMRQHWPRVRAFAPGKASAQALHSVSGLTVDYPQGREASEMLLQLPVLQRLAGRQALILRGNGGRELLADTLATRGARVICCECYQRNTLHYNGDQQARHWQQLAVDTLVVTSGDLLRRLVSLIPAAHHPWLLRCLLLVVSERLATLARQLGWRHIAIADNADNDALLRALQLLSDGKPS